MAEQVRFADDVRRQWGNRIGGLAALLLPDSSIPARLQLFFPKSLPRIAMIMVCPFSSGWHRIQCLTQKVGPFQKFASVDANAYNHFSRKRHLVDREAYNSCPERMAKPRGRSAHSQTPKSVKRKAVRIRLTPQSRAVIMN